MTSAIIAAVEDATGVPFKPHVGQRKQLKWFTDPRRDPHPIDAVVADIPAQIERWRERLSEETGLAKALIPVAWLTQMLDLRFAGVNISNESALNSLRIDQAVELGQMLERKNNPLADPEIVAAYAEIEGRYPDKDGHAFWLVHKNGGMLMPTIRDMMRGHK